MPTSTALACGGADQRQCRCAPLPTIPRCRRLLALPAYAVGGRTADAALRAGLRQCRLRRWRRGRSRARHEDASARAARRVLYLAGEDRSGDLAGDLAAAGDRRRRPRWSIARSRPSAFPPDVRDALSAGWIDGRAAFLPPQRRDLSRLRRRRRHYRQALAPVHYCLSQQVAEPLAAAGARATRVAEQPERGGADWAGEAAERVDSAVRTALDLIV